MSGKMGMMLVALVGAMTVLIYMIWSKLVRG